MTVDRSRPLAPRAALLARRDFAPRRVSAGFADILRAKLARGRPPVFQHFGMPDLRELGITGPAPARLVEGGPPTEASIFVCKNADHPLSYRQSQILPRWGIEIHRFTLADWVGVASLHPGPVVDRLSEHLQASTCSWMKQRHLCPIPATNHSKSRIDDPAPMERPAVKLKTKRS